MILLIISAMMFCPVLITYLETGLVPQFPTLIVSGFIALAAIQSFFAGLILSTIVMRGRQEFEIHLMEIENERKEKIINSRGGHDYE